MELYFHIPFCVRKCRYCDFLSFPCGSSEKSDSDCCGSADMERYVDALICELEGRRSEYEGEHITSVFIGGGTPSVLPCALLERLLCQIQSTVFACNAPGDCTEFSMECNPGTVSREKLMIMKKYGVNRISFGLQSAQNRELEALGRIHSFETFLESYRLARECGFDNINVDLMTAIPYQTIESLADTLHKVMELRPEHISAYSLILEEGTPLYDAYDKDPETLCLPDEDTERDMYHLTEKILRENGYDRYEISNYARKGKECRHNVGYWTGEEYIGLGLGSASYLSTDNETKKNIKDLDGRRNAVCMVRTVNGSDLEEYINAPCAVRETVETLTREDLMSEFMILRLRLMKGASDKDFFEKFGCTMDEVYGEINDQFISEGLLMREDDALRLTQRGFDLANIVMRAYLPDKTDM